MSAFAVIVPLIALLIGCAGLLLLSQATAGVGVLCFACLLAILGRIAQASDQHHQIKQALEKSASTGR